MKKTIDNIVFILGAILLIIVVSLKDNYFMMLSCIAGFSSVIGLLLLINKNNYWAITLPIGLSLTVSVLLYKYKKYDLSTSVIVFFLLSLCLIMINTLIKYYLTTKKSEKTHSLEVEAEITDLVRNPNFAIDYYMPVLSYKIKGEAFEVNYIKYYAKNIPNIGDTIKINVNPNDYYDVYFREEKATVIKNYVSSISIILLTVYFLLKIFL